MGFSISWIAFGSKTREEVLAITRLKDTDQSDEANESPISGALLPNGWYVLFLNDYNHPFVSSGSARRLSLGCKLLVCQIEEHVMASSTCFYENGLCAWAVSHRSDKGIYDLEVQGSLPEIFSSVKECLTTKQNQAGGAQANVDYIFDVPVELAAQICGYRHDRWKFDWGQPDFTILR